MFTVSLHWSLESFLNNAWILDFGLLRKVRDEGSVLFGKSDIEREVATSSKRWSTRNSNVMRHMMFEQSHVDNVLILHLRLPDSCFLSSHVVLAAITFLDIAQLQQRPDSQLPAGVSSNDSQACREVVM